MRAAINEMLVKIVIFISEESFLCLEYNRAEEKLESERRSKLQPERKSAMGFVAVQFQDNEKNRTKEEILDKIKKLDKI